MTITEIYATLTQIFNGLFGRDDLVLRPEMTGRDVPGWDSFKLVEIVLAVEQHYGVRLQSKELDSLETIGDFARVLAAKTNGG
ncbi:MAG TPA: acyl carrier protein [Stellaceae bacterium]|nr:acyl carrier protein [Stellaceae bacterium]